jgi:hypothetical protein
MSTLTPDLKTYGEMLDTVTCDASTNVLMLRVVGALIRAVEDGNLRGVIRESLHFSGGLHHLIGLVAADVDRCRDAINDKLSIRDR